MKVLFAIRRYKNDQVFCDMVLMHTGDIRLGRHWQFDRKVIYDGFLNCYTFTHNGKKIVLVPLFTN